MPTGGTIRKWSFLVISHISPVISKELVNKFEKRGNPEIKSVRAKLSPTHGQKALIIFFFLQWKRNWLVKSVLNETRGAVR